MRFAEVIGHTELKACLVRAVAEKRISHAQLFSGKCGSGTLPLALAYAQYVNCHAPADGDSCGVCPSCVKMSALAHPDLHFVFPVNTSKAASSQKPLSDSFLNFWRDIVSGTGGYFDESQWYRAIDIENKQGIISKNEADEILRKLSFKSFEAEYKVVIIWLPERMRPEAANAILKILEEPWEKTVFLLVSPEPSKLLSTIISRVQEVSVPGIESPDLAAYITEKLHKDHSEAGVIADLSNGDLIEAVRICGQEGNDAVRIFFDLFTSLMRLSYNDKHMELMEWAENASSLGREQMKQFFSYSQKLLRDSYMLNAGMKNIVYLYGEEKDFCTKFSPFIGNHNIERLVAENERAAAQIAQNGNAKIIMTHYALVVSKLINRL